MRTERADRARAGAARRLGREPRARDRASSARTRCRLLSKNANTSLLGDRRHAGVVLDAGVVVGDERDARVVHAELAGEIRLGVLRHVDDVPTLRPVPTRLGARREPRSGDHHDRPARRACVLRRARPTPPRWLRDDRGSTDRRRTRGARRPRRSRCRAGPRCGRRAGRARRSRPGGCRARSDPAAHGPITWRTPSVRSAQRFARAGNAARRVLVVAAVAGDERDAAAADVGDRDRSAGRAERRVDDDLFEVSASSAKS